MCKFSFLRPCLVLLVLLVPTHGQTTSEEAPADVIVMKKVMMPMRDGVKLANDLYLPARDGRPLEGRSPVGAGESPTTPSTRKPEELLNVDLPILEVGTSR